MRLVALEKEFLIASDPGREDQRNGFCVSLTSLSNFRAEPKGTTQKRPQSQLITHVEFSMS